MEVSQLSNFLDDPNKEYNDRIQESAPDEPKENTIDVYCSSTLKVNSRPALEINWNQEEKSEKDVSSPSKLSRISSISKNSKRKGINIK